MAEETDKSQKTEQPTQRRLDKAREDGQIAFSKDVNHWLMLLTFALILHYLLPYALRKITVALKYYLEFAAQIPFSSGHLIHLTNTSMKSVGLALALPALFMIIAALLAGFGQTKFNISFKGLEPKLNKVSPIEGFKRLFGAKALIDFLKNIIKFTVITVIAYFVMKPEYEKLPGLLHLSTMGLLAEITESFLKLLTVIISVLTVVALLDYGWQKFHLMQQLKMSKQEIKEEHKDMEGDPHIKAKLRQLRDERSRQRMIQDVPTSTVILTNPTHYAVALKFIMAEMEAPIVIAKGTDAVALKIKEVASDHDIPVLENPPLTRVLYANVDIGEQIPQEYFEAVARVIRYVLGFEKHYQGHLDDGLDSPSPSAENPSA
jgi:flagellar biosynthetic protein FlhB